MMEEIKNRSVIWAYEIFSFKTGKIIHVLSRKYMHEFSENLYGYYCIKCDGGYNQTGAYTEF